MPLSQDKFAAKLSRALESAGLEHDIEYDPEQFALAWNGQTVNLHNFYVEYGRLGFFDRRKYFKELVASALAIGDAGVPERFEDARGDLLPRVRDLAFWGIWGLQCKVRDVEFSLPPHVRLAEVLGIEIVYDTETAVATIPDNQLEQWGKTFDELLPLALENLRARSAEPFESPIPGLYMSPWHDAHDASRLLLVDRIAELDIAGHRLAMVPHRDLLLVADSNELDAVAGMAALAGEQIGDPRFVSAALLRLEDGTWKRHRLPESHPLAETFSTLEHAAAANDYNQQKDLLDKLHEASGEDVYVATVGAFATGDDEPARTWSTWSRGVPTLLPRTHLVGFVDLENPDDLVMAPWARVREIAGHHMRPMGMFPERYRIDDGPSAEELARLKQFHYGD